MEYIIHLTDSCNLRCAYCYENKANKDISIENIKRLIDYVNTQKEDYSIIVFYGGEPLLKKDLIRQTIEYIKSKKSKTAFYFSMTTNGVLIDDDFLEYMKNNNFISIAYSIDGMEESQNLNRITIDGKGTFEIVKKNALKVLNTFDESAAMSVITKNNLSYLSENVAFLIKIGFRFINLQLDYSEDWQDEDLIEIRKQYEKITDIYAQKILEESDLEIPMIDEKIKTYINSNYNCNKDCMLGMKSINVGTDGKFYPCMQFVYNPDFVIGNCVDGIDIKARTNLIKNSNKENEVCTMCAIRNRCKHTCACKNYILTKDINELSPVICEIERILVELSDKMAEKLYAQNSKMFIQKYYNKDYNILRKIVKDYKNRR